jgi:hypothetical protein
MVWSYCHMAILPENPATRLGGGKGRGPCVGPGATSVTLGPGVLQTPGTGPADYGTMDIDFRRSGHTCAAQLSWRVET